MKFKQKHDTVQDLLNTVQTGGGGGGSIDPSNYYTKTQCDDKFLTQSAATAYQPISGMSSYALKTEAVPEVTSSDNNKVLKSAYSSSTGSYDWQTINEVPTVTSSDNGKILRANYFNATGTSTVTWENPPEELPVVGLNDSGKVLQAHVNATTSETSVSWADVATLPSYSNALDGDMLVVHETNGTRTLQWQNYIPATKNPADIGKVLTVSYTDASVDVPTLSWTTPSGGSGLPDYSGVTSTGWVLMTTRTGSTTTVDWAFPDAPLASTVTTGDLGKSLVVTYDGTPGMGIIEWANRPVTVILDQYPEQSTPEINLNLHSYMIIVTGTKSDYDSNTINVCATCYANSGQIYDNEYVEVTYSNGVFSVMPRISSDPTFIPWNMAEIQTVVQLG